MSMKCDASPDDLVCERKSCKTRNASRNLQSSSKAKGYRDDKTTFVNCGSSLKSSTKQVKRPRKLEDCKCVSNEPNTVCHGPILKKTRVDHSTEPPITICNNNTIESTKNERKKGGVKRTKQKNKTKRTKKKKKKKKKSKKKRGKNNCKNTSVWRSVVCARFIQFLFKICCCSEYLDSSSTSRPCTNTCCCHCSHCKCCFCRPKSDSKYVQCDEYEQSACVASSRRESVDLDDSMNKVASCRPNDKNKKSRKCVTQAKREPACGKIQGDFLLVPCPGRSTDGFNDTTNYGNDIKRDIEETKSSERCFISLRCFKKRQSPTKSSANERPMLKDCSVGESITEICGCCEKKNVEHPARKHCKFQKTRECECDLKIPCVNGNCGKTKRVLLVMFDILFWPYTCLPRRCAEHNKTKKRVC